jgi:hypothetical protein
MMLCSARIEPIATVSGVRGTPACRRLRSSCSIPSTADATADDPTIRRCIGYARRWGYGMLLVGNLFALRSTDPRQLYDHPEPVGPDNDASLHEIVSNAERTIAAWGTHGTLHGRGYEVTEQLDVTLYALDTTQDGHPNHPLYTDG